MSAEAAATAIHVEVAWSPAPREMRLARVTLASGATLADALRGTGWPVLDAAPEGDEALAAAGLSVAVWGQSRVLTDVLRDGDRVEVLRALTIAPMDARRVRYEAAGGVKALRKRNAVAVPKG